jgi:hypothetical protein
MKAFPHRLHLAALALLLVVAAPGCVGFPDMEFGSLQVRVQDAAGAPVNGAIVAVGTTAGELISSETTPGVLGEGDGGAGFLLGAGTYRVQVTPPAGYTVPATQSNPVNATVRADQTTRVTFTLAAQ